MVRALTLAVVLVLSRAASAQAPEPTGKRPRILLDDTLRATWKQQAQTRDVAITRAIERCEDTRNNPKDYKRDSYMGFDWSASLAACLIAFAVRGSEADAKSAVQFVEALLDDLEYIGDKKGGFGAIKRDTGYPIRSLPPYVAIAYDWLHGHPVMTTALKQRIRERLEQWVAWYRKEGYHRRTPANNYHAGYVFSATLTAVALGGEGGEFGSSLWRHVRDDIWGKDMAKVLAPGGLLDGGDFPEGWQYAPLSVAEYSMTALVAAAHGLKTDGVDRWLAGMLMRTVHARSGARDTIAHIGDVEEKTASIAVHPLTLLAIILGAAPDAARAQAAGEYNRLALKTKDNFFYVALAQARKVKPQAIVLDKWPTAYFAPGTHIFYGRTTWAKEGVWMTTYCNPTPNEDADHLAPSAGNILITRGVDEVIVDPTPYGSLSTLTSNAPTVDSKQHLPKYRPSQATWGETTHFVWAAQTASGVMAARCDYADQYKFQERRSDIPLALRDIVLVPWGKSKGDASIVILDRAETSGPDYQMYLRFRSPSQFTLDAGGNVARAKVGASTVTIHKVSPSTATVDVRAPKVEECWNADRGKCDAARFPVGEYRAAIPGPVPQAIHVIDVGGGDTITAVPIAPHVTHLRRGTQDAYVAGKATSYSVTPSAGAIHVVLSDAADQKVTVTKDGARCKMQVETGSGEKRQAGPIVVIVDAQCKATDDARTGPAMADLAGSGASTLVPVGGVPQRSKRGGGGCCDGGSGSASIVLGMFVMAGIRRRRR